MGDVLNGLQMVAMAMAKVDTDSFCYFNEGLTGSAVEDEHGQVFLEVPAEESPKLTRGDVLAGTITGYVDPPPSEGGDNTCKPFTLSPGRVVGPWPFGGVKVLDAGLGLRSEGGRSLNVAGFNGGPAGVVPLSGRLMISTDSSHDGQSYPPIAADFPGDVFAQSGASNTTLNVWGGDPTSLGWPLWDKDQTDLTYGGTHFSRRGFLPRLVVFSRQLPVLTKGSVPYDLGGFGVDGDPDGGNFFERGKDGVVRLVKKG